MTAATAPALKKKRHSRLPISAVAASVGFEDPLYFSRVFRRQMGLSPTEYRESAKED